MEVDADFTIWVMCNYCLRAFVNVDHLVKHKIHNHIRPKTRITWKTKYFNGNFLKTRSRRVPVVATVVPDVRTRRRTRKSQSSWVIDDPLDVVKTLPEEFIVKKSVSEDEEKAPSVLNEEEQAPSLSNEEENVVLVSNEAENVVPVSHEQEGPPSLSYEEEGPPSLLHEEEGPPSLSHEEEGPPSLLHEEEGPPSLSHEEKGPPSLSHDKELQLADSNLTSFESKSLELTESCHEDTDSIDFLSDVTDDGNGENEEIICMEEDGDNDLVPSVTSYIAEESVPDTKEETETENSSSVSFKDGNMLNEVLCPSKPKNVLKQLHNHQSMSNDYNFSVPCIESSVSMLTRESKAPQYRDFIYVRNQDSIDELEHETLAKKNNRVSSSIIGCPICAVELLSRNSLLSHLTRGCIKCPSCKTKVSNQVSEYNSIATHFEKSPECYPLKCQTCEQLYHSYSSLRGHALVHAYDPKALPLFKTYA